MDSLSERVEELKQDKKRLVEEYEAKLSKVRPLVDETLRKKMSCAMSAHILQSTNLILSFSFCLLNESMILRVLLHKYVQSQCAFATSRNVTSGKVILGVKN